MPNLASVLATAPTMANAASAVTANPAPQAGGDAKGQEKGGFAAVLSANGPSAPAKPAVDPKTAPAATTSDPQAIPAAALPVALVVANQSAATDDTATLPANGNLPDPGKVLPAALPAAMLALPRRQATAPVDGGDNSSARNAHGDDNNTSSEDDSTATPAAAPLDPTTVNPALTPALAAGT